MSFMHLYLCSECMRSTAGKCTIASKLTLLLRMHTLVCHTGVTVHYVFVYDVFVLYARKKTVNDHLKTLKSINIAHTDLKINIWDNLHDSRNKRSYAFCVM